ncbi:hypothetical protein BIW11_00620, partial [Tropilaelaps mercedesae]
MPITKTSSSEDGCTFPSAPPRTQKSGPSENETNLAVDRYIASIWRSVAEKRVVSEQRAPLPSKGAITLQGDLAVYKCHHCMSNMLELPKDISQALQLRSIDMTVPAVLKQNLGDIGGHREVTDEAEKEANGAIPPRLHGETSQRENLNNEQANDPISETLQGIEKTISSLADLVLKAPKLSKQDGTKRIDEACKPLVYMKAHKQGSQCAARSNSTDTPTARGDNSQRKQ